MHSFNIDIIFLPSIIIQLLSFIIFNAGQDIYYMYIMYVLIGDNIASYASYVITKSILHIME